MRRDIGTSGTTLSIPPWDLEGEEEEQDIENLFEQIMKENFSNLAKELDMQVQEARRVPKKLDSRRNPPRHIIIKSSKITKRRAS